MADRKMTALACLQWEHPYRALHLPALYTDWMGGWTFQISFCGARASVGARAVYFRGHSDEPRLLHREERWPPTKPADSDLIKINISPTQSNLLKSRSSLVNAFTFISATHCKQMGPTKRVVNKRCTAGILFYFSSSRCLYAELAATFQFNVSNRCKCPCSIHFRKML